MRPSAPPTAVSADSCSGSGDSAAASVMSAADPPPPSGAAAPGREGSSVSQPLFCVFRFRFYVFTLLCRGQEAVADEEDQEAVSGREPESRQEGERGERGLGEGEVPAQREQDQQLHQHQEQQHLHRRRGPLARQVESTSTLSRLVCAKKSCIYSGGKSTHFSTTWSGTGRAAAAWAPSPPRRCPSARPSSSRDPSTRHPRVRRMLMVCTCKNISTS